MSLAVRMEQVKGGHVFNAGAGLKERARALADGATDRFAAASKKVWHHHMFNDVVSMAYSRGKSEIYLIKTEQNKVWDSFKDALKAGGNAHFMLNFAICDVSHQLWSKCVWGGEPYYDNLRECATCHKCHCETHWNDHQCDSVSKLASTASASTAASAAADGVP